MPSWLTFVSATAAVALLCAAHLCVAVPVQVVSLDYISGKPLAGKILQWLENGTNFTTDANGMVTLDADVGTNITIDFAGDEEYHQVQSVTVTVPPEGLTTEYTQIVMQTPSNLMFDLFFFVTPGSKNHTACQVVVTVCNVNKTVHDHAQGLPGTVAVLTPANQQKTFYFGTWGKLSNETNPLPNNLTSTSFDGGVLFEDLPISDEWYVVTAYHEGYTFSSSTFRCTKPGLFVNGAPNQGPRATPISRPEA
jgi:hypothetical protein